MKDTVANKINSFVTTLGVVDDPDYTSVWQAQPPAAFSAAITRVRPLVVAVQNKGAQQSANIKGFAAQLRILRESFETNLHALARAVYRCLLAQGNAADAEKANLTPSTLRNARGIALAGLGETVLDLAEPLLTGTPAPAAAYFTQGQYDITDQQWQQFSVAVGSPATARSKRKGLTTELPADVRDIETVFAECDDYLPQFALASDLGRQFSDAWFNARQVIDLGKRAAKPNNSTAPEDQGAAPAPPSAKP